MSEQRRTYLRLAAALALVLAVMAWVTATLLRLESERSESERSAVVQEQLRLSLWRIDSAMTPILSREAALLDAPVPAPASLPAAGPGVVTRFHLEGGNLRPLTQTDPARLESLRDELHATELSAELARGLPLVDAGLDVASGEGDENTALDIQQAAEATPYALKTQSLRNDAEWSQRRANVEDNFMAYGSLARGAIGSGDAGDLYRLDEGVAPTEREHDVGAIESKPPLEAVWLGGELLLVRRLGTDPDSVRLEGIWLDWPVLRERLLHDVEDLLPEALLVPVDDIGVVSTERLLATLPARLEPGATVAPAPVWSPLRAALIVAWLLVLAAFAGVVLLLRGSIELSERRATFVSAVTHELRTPLTTFRMYTEMLGEGMVEAHKRERYVTVLRREAERLSTLVENVLAYAQIEQERGTERLESVALGELLIRVEERLRERCEGAGMSLELEIDEDQLTRVLLIDPAAVEQILFNLVDNAAKYGCTKEQPRIHVSTRSKARNKARSLVLVIRDFGPGVAPEDAKRVFEPFTKAKAHAAGTKPGVGLGLALSRRLARAIGGELSLSPADPGAAFELELRDAK